MVSNEMADLVNPVPPGVEEDTIMKKMADLPVGGMSWLLEASTGILTYLSS